MMSFGPWKEGSADAEAMKRLFKQREIFEPMRCDGATLDMIDGAKFPSAYLAVFQDERRLSGFVLFIPGDGFYELHVGFVHDRRGAFALEAIQEAASRMFDEKPDHILVATCPDWNRGTRMLARSMGATFLITTSNFAKVDGQTRSADSYSFTAEEWWARRGRLT